MLTENNATNKANLMVLQIASKYANLIVDRTCDSHPVPVETPCQDVSTGIVKIGRGKVMRKRVSCLIL